MNVYQDYIMDCWMQYKDILHNLFTYTKIGNIWE